MGTRLQLAEKAYAAARVCIQNCYVQIHSIAEAEEHFNGYERDEVLEDLHERLTESVQGAVAAVRLVFELLKLDSSQNKYEKRIKCLKDQFSTVEYFDEYIGADNPAVAYLVSQLNLIAPLISTPSQMQVQRRLLAQMLKQIPQYIEQQKVLPKKEKDVQDSLHGVLKLVFPDVIRETTIAKQTKSYKPDFGLDSIETAVEVKFVASQKDAPIAIGGLYEDMHGYANSSFTLFLGFIYMKGNYLTQAQVDAELKKANAPKNWKVLLVFGN